MASAAKNSRNPSIPPKPPNRTSPDGNRGARVRPASELIGARSGRAAQIAANSAASAVPPRMSVEIGPRLPALGMTDQLAPPIEDDHLDGAGASYLIDGDPARPRGDIVGERQAHL